MTDANYSNPITYAQHLGIGQSYKGTVVHVMKGNTHIGSGVLVNNRRCILTCDHVIASGGVPLDPVADNIRIVTDNWMTQNGVSIPASYFVRFSGRITAPSADNDFALVVLSSDLPGGVPAQISTVSPAVTQIMKLVGGGNQATPTIPSFQTGDLIGGQAKISYVSGQLTTQFFRNSTVPLIYNSNNGDSGGAVVDTLDDPQNGVIYGIMRYASAPGNNGYTESVNMTLPGNKGWVDSVTSTIPSIPYVPAVLPELSCEGMGSSNLRLKTNRPSIEEGGEWLLQTSTDFQTWTNSPAVFAPSTPPGFYECVLPIDADKRFFRLKWESD